MRSTAVGRYVTALAYIPADLPLADGALVQPTVFERTEWIVGEIRELACKAVSQMLDLHLARIERDPAKMQEAAVELAKLFAQGQQLADITARVSGARR